MRAGARAFEFRVFFCAADSQSTPGADTTPRALLMVGMMVALRMTRATMVRIAPVAMLMIGMMLTRTCGSIEE